MTVCRVATQLVMKPCTPTRHTWLLAHLAWRFRVPGFQGVHHAVPVVVGRSVRLPVHRYLPQAGPRGPRGRNPEFTVPLLETVYPVGQRDHDALWRLATSTLAAS